MRLDAGGIGGDHQASGLEGRVRTTVCARRRLQHNDLLNVDRRVAAEARAVNASISVTATASTAITLLFRALLRRFIAGREIALRIRSAAVSAATAAGLLRSEVRSSATADVPLVEEALDIIALLFAVARVWWISVFFTESALLIVGAQTAESTAIIVLACSAVAARVRSAIVEVAGEGSARCWFDGRC